MHGKTGTSDRRPHRAGLLALAKLVAVPGIARAGQPSARGSDGWIISSHPCRGDNRTDALQMGDDGTFWFGCGIAAARYGLFVSRDGGSNWAAANVTSSDIFTPYRVSSIARGHDGALYVAGISSTQGTSQMVLRVDSTSTP